MAIGRWFILILCACVSAQGLHGQESAPAPAVPAHADSDPVLEHRPASAAPATTDSDPAVAHRPAPASRPAVPEIIPLLVPSMLLQPLVENCIKHGLAPKVEGGTIRIRSRLTESHLTLEVEDDGVGMSASRESQKVGEPEGAGKINPPYLPVRSN